MPETPIPDAALSPLLDWLMRLDTSTVEQLALRLYVNDITPGPSSMTGDFVEASFGGYSQRTLPRSAFDAATLTGHTATITRLSSPLVWTPLDSGQVVYGAFVVGQASNNLYSARRFASRRTIEAGTPVRLLPVWSLTSVTV